MPMPCWPQAVKLRAVQEATEHFRNLRTHDARPVVLHRDAESCLGKLHDLDSQLGKDAGLFACIERVVDGFFHRRQERLRRIVEPEQVAVLREEFRHRDVALLLREVRRAGALGLRRRGRGRARIPGATASGARLRRTAAWCA
jgi:hypothetical protein